MCVITIRKWKLCSHNETTREVCNLRRHEDERQRKREDSFCGLGCFFTRSKPKDVCKVYQRALSMPGRCRACMRQPRPNAPVRPPRPDQPLMAQQYPSRHRPGQPQVTKEYLNRPLPPLPLNPRAKKPKPSRLPAPASAPPISQPRSQSVPAGYYSSKEQSRPLPPLLPLDHRPRGNGRVLTTQPPSKPPTRPLPALPTGVPPSRIPKAQTKDSRMAKVGSPPPVTLSAPPKGRSAMRGARPAPIKAADVSYANEPTPVADEQFMRLVSDTTGEIPIVYTPAPSDVAFRR
ncbi:hypothetical protein QBC34DRAFT_22160 [Podospora aff. communis PSN243]|uniref:Uncharacterized protein n=1 Tax=Podospora aff. communis PSN243 TaxID=3040156 RepID=A0AAV9GYU9_9PEZI|nr:hypothetical protein QBC34DRAFT_22160 [Podospora aff. communis PSN243]